MENFHRLILGYFSFPYLNPNLIVTTCFSAEPAVTNLLKNIHCFLTFIYLNKNFSGSPQYCLNLLFQAVFFHFYYPNIGELLFTEDKTSDVYRGKCGSPPLASLAVKWSRTRGSPPPHVLSLPFVCRKTLVKE